MNSAGCRSDDWTMPRVKHYHHLPLLQQVLQNKLSLTLSGGA